MNVQVFEPKQGKDEMFYLRIIAQSKGKLGNIIDKAGFLKFETEEEANNAKTAIEGGDVTITAMLPIANSNLHEVVYEFVHA